MEDKKVLICCPLGDGKEYSINEWFDWIANQVYTNFDVAVCVNGKTEASIKHKVELLRQVEINGKKLIVLELEYNQYFTTEIKRSRSRELLRMYAVEHDYDFMFWLDSDTIPVILDAIPQLMNENKDFISGLYFYKNSKQPIIIDEKTRSNISMRKIEEIVHGDGIFKVWGCGFGCVLLSREVFSKIPFDYTFKRESWTDDFQYCEYAEKAGFDRWFKPLVCCKHFSDKDFVIDFDDGKSENQKGSKDKTV